MNSNAKDLKSLGSGKTKYELSKVCPEVLETFETNESLKGNEDGYTLVPFQMQRDEFTSLCPKTGQPDTAKMEIIYVPTDKMVESKSLKLYLFSFRNTGEFHEDVCNRIANDLYKLMKPLYLRVYGDFAPRGGLAIKPLVERWNTFADKDKEMQAEIRALVHSWDTKK